MEKKNLLNHFGFSIFLLYFLLFIIEYILGHQPCNLCLFKGFRIFSILTIIFYSKINFKKKNLSIILAIFFIIGAFLSIYHLGIEQGVFEESFVCDLHQKSQSNKRTIASRTTK